jgi:small subunit ribosomal protein S1
MDREDMMAEEPNATQPEETPAVSATEDNEIEQEIEATIEAVAPDGQESAEAVTAEVEQSAEEPAEAKESTERPTDVEALKPGMRLKGQVRNVVDFGAFVDIGVGRDGLAHISTLRKAGIDKTVKVGDVIDVQVRRIDEDSNRISLTIPGAGKGSKTSLRELETGAMITGRVVRLVDFGAFVDIGAQTDGLLHISQLSGGFVNHPSEVLNVGDEVEVRIQDVDAQRRRISLTMKDASEDMPAPQERERGRERERVAPAQQSTTPEEQVPTAFQAAWERALSEQRRQRS